HFVFADQAEGRATVQRYLDEREDLVLEGVVLDASTHLANEFNTVGLPTTLFFDSDGNHVFTHSGELSSVLLANYLSDMSLHCHMTMLASRRATGSWTELRSSMIVSTTPSIEGRPAREYLGLVAGETILGANILRDFMAGIRDIVGGRSGAYERSLREAKDNAVAEMIEAARALGADAVLSVDLDYESISFGQGGGMLMVTASGTAVKL